MSTSERSGRGWRRTILVALIFGLWQAAPARAQTVFSTSQLIELSRSTYQRGDWIYAALHMNALVQRNPEELQNNPVFVKELVHGITFAIQQLQEAQRLAGLYQDAKKTSSSSGGVGRVSSGLSSSPPPIHWPTKHGTRPS